MEVRKVMATHSSIQTKLPAEILLELIKRYPSLESCKNEIFDAFESMKKTYQKGGKALIAGNGGSAADAEHISGELMKSFLFRRPIEEKTKTSLAEHFGKAGIELASKLEGALPALPLVCLPGISTAFANDVDPSLTFAQLVYAIGKPGDVFIGISTSGNSGNIIKACMTAKAKGISTIGLTGQSGGKLNNFCDIVIHAPSNITFEIQEYHLPIYHAICAMLEAEFFGEYAVWKQSF